MRLQDAIAAAFCAQDEAHPNEPWYSLSTDDISTLIERAVLSWMLTNLCVECAANVAEIERSARVEPRRPTNG